MNLAFQALLVFILLLPGLLLRSTYNGRIAKELVLPENYPPFSREAVRILGYSVILHACWVPLSNLVGAYYWGVNVDLHSVLYMLMGDYGDAASERTTIQSVTNNPLLPLLYFSSLYITSALLGFTSHKAIRKYGLDKRNRFFRFNNDWHYLLTGEVREFHDVEDEPHEVDLVLISAVIDVAGEAVLYAGFVEDYSLDGKGNLKSLRLRDAFRRTLQQDRKNDDEPKPFKDDDRYYRIDGDYFILDCANARNLNIKYMYVKAKKSDSP